MVPSKLNLLMLDHDQALELLPPTPLLVVVADAVPDPVDLAVAADPTLLYQVVNPVSGFTFFFILSLLCYLSTVLLFAIFLPKS